MERNTALLNKFQIPAWLFNVRECRITWANQLGLEHWKSCSLDELCERKFADDMSETVRLRLEQYLEDCLKYRKTIFDEWTVYPNGKPKTMKMAFCMGDDSDPADSLLVQVVKEDIRADPGALHGIQALMHTSSLISVFDEHNQLVYANPASRALFTQSKLNLSEYFEDEAEVENIYRKLKMNQRAHCEARVNTKNGLRWHSMHLQKCRDPESGAATCLISATDITEEREAKLELTRLAFSDPLTGLLNRRALVDKVNKCIRTNERDQFAIVFVDVDRFKLINDSLGHHIGDLLLNNIADLLTEVFSGSATVARLSGDEFALVTNTGDLELISYKVALLRKRLFNPVVVGNYRLRVSLSIGISRYPFDGVDADSLLQNADIAKQSAKSSLLPYRCFDAALGNACKRRLEIERDLINALEKEEFVLHYQPKINAKDQSVAGVEALVRWQHPERGLVSPLEFIPVAEETGLIVDLGEWVLGKAIADQVNWAQQGHHASVAVNVSPLQFNSPEFPDIVSGLLELHGCSADNLNLEITESTLSSDEDMVQEILNGFCRQGITISIDDFGTGYSNLANLRKFPINCLKIDRAFVSDPDHAELLQTILELGKSMRLRMVAEGVETAEQVAWLTDRHCDEFQGFFFSKPLSNPDLLAFFRAHRGGGQFSLAA
jgi:diguanylate cyclase (GGDEF)-like protein